MSENGLITATSGVIINADQVQSIDIPDQFEQTPIDNGWIITVSQTCKVAVNMSTSMRKIEMLLVSGDQIKKDQHDLMIMRHQPADAYRSRRTTTSPLAINPKSVGSEN